MQDPSIHKENAKKRTWFIIGIVLAVLLVGAIGALASRVSDVPSPDEVITHSTDKPSEKPLPVEATTYNVAADMPKAIYLSSVGAEGLIQKAGIDQTGRIAVPTNVNLASWYVNSVKPGERGLSIISGHVDGREGPGIFKRLGDLRRGDPLTVEYGDGSTQTFVVKEVTHVVQGDAASLLFAKQKDIDAQLNLITCAGTFDPNTRTYDQRIVVVTERVE